MSKAFAIFSFQYHEFIVLVYSAWCFIAATRDFNSPSKPAKRESDLCRHRIPAHSGKHWDKLFSFPGTFGGVAARASRSAYTR